MLISFNISIQKTNNRNLKAFFTKKINSFGKTYHGRQLRLSAFNPTGKIPTHLFPVYTFNYKFTTANFEQTPGDSEEQRSPGCYVLG